MMTDEQLHTLAKQYIAAHNEMTVMLERRDNAEKRYRESQGAVNALAEQLQSGRAGQDKYIVFIGSDGPFVVVVKHDEVSINHAIRGV